jgi:hypothetical protein
MEQLTTAAIAALTAFGSTVAATPVRYLIDKRLNRNKEQLAYEYAQRRELAALVAKFHGRLLDEGDALHQRLLDIWRFEDKSWLDLQGDYDNDNGRRPYFFTTVYRFVSFAALGSGFERGVLYLDERLAAPRDLLLHSYVRALRWAVTDTRVFAGLGYDFSRGRDHLYRDLYRSTCEAILTSDANANELHYREFEALVDDGRSMRHVLEFFDGLNPQEERLRWDRLVVFDLLLMSMLSAVGYRSMDCGEEHLKQVAAELRHPQIALNLLEWLPALGLASHPEGKLLATALEAVGGSVRGLPR